MNNRRDLAEAQAQASLNENRLLEERENLEMAMLDKEVAEERAETAEGDAEALRQKVAELEVELAALQGDEGNEGDSGEGGKTSLKDRKAILVLERQNARLKDVLVRYVV